MISDDKVFELLNNMAAPAAIRKAFAIGYTAGKEDSKPLPTIAVQPRPAPVLRWEPAPYQKDFEDCQIADVVTHKATQSINRYCVQRLWNVNNRRTNDYKCLLNGAQFDDAIGIDAAKAVCQKHYEESLK